MMLKKYKSAHFFLSNRLKINIERYFLSLVSIKQKFYSKITFENIRYLKINVVLTCNI